MKWAPWHLAQTRSNFLL